MRNEQNHEIYQIMALSSMLGFYFGWLYWILGLEWAIISHFCFDAFVSMVLIPVYMMKSPVASVILTIVMILGFVLSWYSLTFLNTKRIDRMDFDGLVQEIETRLDNNADSKRLKWAKKNYATSMILKGVTVPNIRPIVKEMNKRFKKSPAEEVVEFAKQLNATRILEAQQIAFEVLDKHKAARQSLTLKDLLELGEGMDNWVSVDYFAGMLAGPAWRDGQIPNEVVEEWAKSEDKWWRRAAVVCTVALNQKARGGSGEAKRTMKICSLVAADKDDMVAKGLSWALREMAKREVEPVVEFVNQNEDVLPRRVVREVRKKIDTGRKYG